MISFSAEVDTNPKTKVSAGRKLAGNEDVVSASLPRHQIPFPLNLFTITVNAAQQGKTRWLWNSITMTELHLQSLCILKGCHLS